MITLANEFSRAIDKMRDTPQPKQYHPEVWVWNHESLVFYSILNNTSHLSNTQQKELLWTALFHDLGKIDKTWYREKKERYVSYGHEKAALPYYDATKEALVDKDLRPEVIRFLIRQHMKPKFIDRMNEGTVEKLKKEANNISEDVWNLLMEFAEHDDASKLYKNSDKTDRYEAQWLFHNFCEKAIEKINLTYSNEKDSFTGELFILRGASGSGKSTVAQLLENNGAYQISADQFFIREDGKYRYDGSKISEAHDYSKRRTEDGMVAERETIAVHNTFTEDWQMIYYFYLAAKYNYRVHTLLVENRHESDTIHNVPENKIEDQREEMELKL